MHENLANISINHFFNSCELIVKNPGIEHWSYKWGWYLKYQSW
jgi:hypothetical protein